MLKDRDYTLIIDKSGSMSVNDQRGSRSRWAAARQSAQALAYKCEQLDPNGLTLYLFGTHFCRYEHVTPERVARVFEENEPGGGTDLAKVLSHAFDTYFFRRGRGETRAETMVIITDGEPDDGCAVITSIIHASQRLHATRQRLTAKERKTTNPTNEDELAISFVHVGADMQARYFLEFLDDQLAKANTPDICDTVTLDELERVGVTEVLRRAISD